MSTITGLVNKRRLISNILAGSGFGGLLGAVVNKDNRLKGALIGGGLGGAAGAGYSAVSRLKPQTLRDEINRLQKVEEGAYKTRLDKLAPEFEKGMASQTIRGDALVSGLKQIIDSTRKNVPGYADLLAKPTYGGPASLSYKTWLYPHLGGAALGGATGLVVGDDYKSALIGAGIGGAAGIGLNSYWKKTLPAIKIDPNRMMGHVRDAVHPEYPNIQEALIAFNQ